jgi:beta-fructofuranosidase
MSFFYTPAEGIVGDAIPYAFDGRYHVFYLHDLRDPASTGYGWAHVSTTDFVHFEEHGEALPSGGVEEQDLFPATGSVFTDETGRHHIYYTGINPAFRNDAQRHQAILHATSDDLVTWTKVPGEVWYADESRYERHDWRDPFVFTHPGTRRYTMLVTARTNSGATLRRGCTGLLTSDDLRHWSVEAPFYAPGRYYGHECPDLFRLGGWYYLVFSEYRYLEPSATGGLTRYVMSRSVDGPWVAPRDDRFDTRAFYAAKTAGDGERRFVFGWNPTRAGDADDGEWQWGGCLTVHELLQEDDGTLSVRLPPEAARTFGAAAPLVPGGSSRLEATYAYEAVLGDALPATCLLEGELTFEHDAGSAGVLVGGYFLRFDQNGQALQFGKVGGSGRVHLDRMPELDRPLQIRPGEPLRFTIVVDGSALVAYVGDRAALSARMYADGPGRSGLFADGTLVSVVGFALRRGP